MSQILQSLEVLVSLTLREDLGEVGDITSNSTLPHDLEIRGQIRAKADGVIAGLEAVTVVYQQLDPDIQVGLCVEDGARVQVGDVVCEIHGNARHVLAGERTALNFLQRLSGIATMTRQFVDIVEGTNATILDTRKTTPAWRSLEKYAVKMGGGQNHRMGLYDEVLIKDNHIDAAGSITAAVNAVHQHVAESVPIVVEVKDQNELREALSLNITRILLDNMTVDEMREAVRMTNGKMPLEASGNVNVERVRAIAETGVDFISIGAITHSAPILDLSMRLM